MKKPYIESEVQGPGRRFWFSSVAACKKFAAAKRRAGYAVVHDEGSRTMWAARSKKKTFGIDLVVRGGVDPWGM